MIGSAPAAAQGDPPPSEIAWVEPRLDEALARAFERNVPIAIFACLADEPQNEEFRLNLAGNATLARALADAVPIYASNGEPPPGAKLVRHKALMDEVYNRWVAENTPDGSWSLPEVMLIHPNGSILRTLGSGNTVSDSEVLSALADVRKKLGPAISAQDATRIAAFREQAHTAHEAKDWAAAWRGWSAILAVTRAGPIGTEAALRITEAEAGLAAIVAAFTMDLDAAALPERYAFLRELVRHDAAGELRVAADRHLAALEKDKRFKVEMRALRLEEEALDLLHEAETAFARGDEKAAAAALRKLGAARLAKTKGAATARERYPKGK